jgi:hypothetical protein
VSVTKTELYTILRDVCIVSRDVCIVSNRLTCIDAKLSEMEILAQPLSLLSMLSIYTLFRKKKTETFGVSIHAENCTFNFYNTDKKVSNYISANLLIKNSYKCIYIPGVL